MRRMNHRGLMATALEAAVVADTPSPAEVEGLNPAEEGLKGAALGFVGGLFGIGTVTGGVLSNMAERKKKEIEAIAKELDIAAADAGKKAVKEGKLSSDDFKKHVQIGSKGVIRGVILGTLFGSIYTAIKGSEVEDLHEELEQRCKELNRILEKQAAKEGKGKGKPANESEAVEGAEGAGETTETDEAAAKPAEAAEAAAGESTEAAATEPAAGAEPAPMDAFAEGEAEPAEAEPAGETPAAEPADAGAETVAEAGAEAEAAAGAEGTDEAAAGGEEVAAEPAAAEPAEPEVVDNSETVEAGLLKVNDDEAAAAQVDEQTEEAVEVATALEEMATCLQSAAGNGGLSRDAAGALNVAVEHMLKRIGMPVEHRQMPALESYGGVSSRVAATQMALENLAEKAKQIWEKIVEAIKKSIAWLVERFKAVFDTAGKLGVRAEELAKAATRATGEPKAKQLDNSRLASSLHIEGKTEGVIAGIERLVKISDDVFSGAVERMNVYKKLADAENLDQIVKMGGELSEFRHAQYKTVENPETQGLPKQPQGTVLRRSDELPGGKAILVTASLGDNGELSMEQLAEIFASVKAQIGDGWPKVELAEDAKLATLSGADAGKLAETVAGLAGVIKKFEADLNIIKTSKTAVVTALEEKAKADKAEGDAAKENKALRSMITSMGRLVDNPIAGLSAYALNTGKHALDYVALSLQQYGKAEASEEAKEPAKEEPKEEKKEPGETKAE